MQSTGEDILIHIATLSPDNGVKSFFFFFGISGLCDSVTLHPATLCLPLHCIYIHTQLHLGTPGISHKGGISNA